jgi:site-specific DNA recombinase
MHQDNPADGAANAELCHSAHAIWMENALNAGIDLTGFNPEATYAERVFWAGAMGLVIGCILSRFSSKMQHSTTAQVLDCVRFAAENGIYVPPELLCVDEATTGRKRKRAGVERMKTILKNKAARVLLVYKVSRLFRSSYQGVQFVNEEVVEEGLRAISVTQGIDTCDEKSWKAQMALHGLMDEMLLSTIADHVRSGLKDLFRRGYITGALTLGYLRQEIPDAPKTNLGRTRTMPAVNPEVAKMIVQHYEWLRDGMSINEGLRRWLQAGGPHDPRSTLGHMAYGAYRRMLANPRYIGLWALGKKRNHWSSKRDCNRQKDGPQQEIIVVKSEELRIVSDELFHAVQARLAELKLGPRGPKTRKQPQLWDLVTDCYFCQNCGVRFYQSGANGGSMSCKKGSLCPCKTNVRRREAARAVCAKLGQLLQLDSALIEQTITRAVELDAAADPALNDCLIHVEAKIVTLSRKIEDLVEMAGQGTDQMRKKLKARVQAAQQELAMAYAEQARIKKALTQESAIITPEQVRTALANLMSLLENAAAGNLGDDLVYRASELFRQLVGGRIEVIIERRQGRKQVNVRGVFRSQIIRVAQQLLNTLRREEGRENLEVSVWLRIPQRELLGEMVKTLIDDEGHTYRSAAKVMQLRGHNINSGVVWQIYKRYYEMIGQPPPKLPYNNGKPRGNDSD